VTAPPAKPKVYHITHVDNLPAIIADGGLVSDRAIIERGGPARGIGMPDIKRRRVDELEVDCHPGTKVGDYVPFNFCPRSVMLYVLHKANNPGLTYLGGQEPIVHLEADLHAVIRWAEGNDRRWAFSLSNAGSRYCEFRSRVPELDQLDWQAIAGTDFSRAELKERKQAEFLVYGRFPFELVERIGVLSEATRVRAEAAVARASRRPPIGIRREWYF
jgi:hypothetical protein